MADNKELQDLVDFLRSPRQEVSSPGFRHATQAAAAKTSGHHSSRYYVEQVQKAAVDLVEGLTGSVDGLEQLMTQSDELLPALLRLIAGDRDVSKAALNSLINLSQASADPKACNFLTK